MALQCSSWSDLPQEILELIFDIAKDPIDILRCGAVCKSWLPIASQVYLKFLAQCFFLSGKVKDGAPLLFNSLTKGTRKIQVPEGKWSYICSNDWLFTVDSKFPYRMQLLNIFSRTQIDLPPSPHIICSLNLKLLQSKSCPFDSNCILFLLRDAYGRSGTISSLKPGEKRWSETEIRYPKIYNAILYKGKLYASIRDGNNKDCLITCNYQLEVEYMVPSPKAFQRYPDPSLRLNNDCLLVSNSGFGAFVGESIVGFDSSKKEFWESNDLDAYPHFLGPNHTFANISSSETSSKATCIYIFRRSEQGRFM